MARVNSFQIWKFLKSKKISFFWVFMMSSVVFSQLVHPGITHKKSDLDRMKYMVESGKEPWLASYNSMKSSPSSSYEYTVNGTESNTTITSLPAFEKDGNAAYYNALMWYITGDERHAKKSVEIFKAWANITRIESQFALSNGGALRRMVEAAEIIKHTYDGWVNSDIEKFKAMLVYPGWSGTVAPTVAMASKNVSFYWNIYQGDRARHGNQGLFAYRSLMAMGIFLDNEIMYQRAFRYLKGYPHLIEDLPYPSGAPVTQLATTGNEYYEEYTITSWSSTIPDYGYNEVMSNYIYENGQSQESARDQAHALGGVSIITSMCEMAWNQGDNLYGHLDNRPLLGMEFYLRYNLSYGHTYADQLTPWEPTVESGEFIERIDRSGRWKSLKMNPWTAADLTNWNRGLHNLNPIYEINLGHYRDRMLLDASDYKWLERGFDVMTEALGVEDGSNPGSHPGYGGLKFRRVSPGDPISGFDADGLPDYTMNALPIMIEAENYDYFVLDGEGRTYSDVNSSNSGNVYRTDEGVDIKVCTEGGYAITDIASGEWLTYTVNVPSNGTYNIDIRYASSNANGKIQFNFGGVEVTSEVTVPYGTSNSTGLTDWQDFTVASSVRLTKGVQQMKVLFGGTDNSFELNNMTISLVTADPDPTNMALLGIASQSTNYKDTEGLAGLAVDGNTDGNYGNGSVSHTASSDNNSWWQVELESESTISTINIFNRTGGNYGQRLSYFRVTVFDESGTKTFTQEYTSAPSPSLTIDTGSIIGKIVKIELLTGSGGMNLAEVEVIGINKVLSNRSIEQNNQIQIYPNPVTDTFTITDCKNSILEIYSVLGKRVIKKVIFQDKEKINISQFKSGVYFVRISYNGSFFTKKIIKK